MPGQDASPLLAIEGRDGRNGHNGHESRDGQAEQQRAGVDALVGLAQATLPVTAPPVTALPVTAPPVTALPQGRPPSKSASLASRYQLLRSPWTLPAILILQVALSVRLIWSNTAFQDESLYLWAGHLELAHVLHGSPVPDFQTYFSGAPVVYPPVAALADSLGGLAAARLLSLAFMMASTVLLYFAAKRLFGRGPAIAGAALFAVFGMADQLGAFATYDAMALFLLALASWLTVRASGKLTEPMLILAACSLALADATKYATVLWNPVVVALAILTAPQLSKLSRCWRGVRLASYTGLLVLAALQTAGPSYVQGIKFTTLERQIVTGTSPLKIIDIAWGWLALLLLLGLMGVLLIWLDNRRATLLPLVLFAAALLAPAEQARISDITSLHKHVVFGAWFACIVAGYAVTRIAQLDGQLSHGVIIGSVLVAAFAATGFSQASSVTRSWPSVSKIMPALGSTIRAAGCPCLILQQTAARYYLPASDLTDRQLVGPYTFSYRSARNWTKASGPPAMAEAILNGFFASVEVDASRGSATYRLLHTSLRKSKQYRLLSTQKWALHPAEPTQVWERKAGSRR